MLRYAKVEDAIARANDTEFGLGGSVWSKNLERAFAVASQINSGTVWINRHLNLQPDIPFRGDKQSGIGTELGHAGLEEYTQPQDHRYGQAAGLMRIPLSSRRRGKLSRARAAVLSVKGVRGPPAIHSLSRLAAAAPPAQRASLS